MITKFWKSLVLFFYPPKRSEVYYGDATNWVSGILEGRRHHLLSKTNRALRTPLYGPSTYMLRIVGVMPSYYICEASVLTKGLNSGKTYWIRRSENKRIPIAMFKDLIAQMALVKLQDWNLD
jgi:hypothetical protein